jgi:RNase adaptor protein for sRNA GlmZ degradation
MSDIEITMVPKDLYYHEVAYVRGLEARNAELVAERDIAWASNAGLTTDVLALRAQNAELVAERDEARRERETMRAERLDECEGLRAQNAELVAALEEARHHFVTTGKLHSLDMRGPIHRIDAALAAAGHP